MCHSTLHLFFVSLCDLVTIFFKVKCMYKYVSIPSRIYNISLYYYFAIFLTRDANVPKTDLDLNSNLFGKLLGLVYVENLNKDLDFSDH